MFEKEMQQRSQSGFKSEAKSEATSPGLMKSLRLLYCFSLLIAESVSLLSLLHNSANEFE